MYVKIILTTLFLLGLQHFLRLLYIMGYHRTIYNHSPGPCRLVPGVDEGSEDMETLPNGLTFITSGLLMPMSTRKVVEYYKDNSVQGRILLFDFNFPENGVRELDIHGNFDKSTFRPHGLSIYQNPVTERIFLFVVNHAPGGDLIEKFEYKVTDKALEYVRSYEDEAIRIANDVAATGEDSFYFTNYAYYLDSFLHKLEAFLFMRLGTVVYYDGKTYTTVASGFSLPNGITVSKDKKYVYMASSFFSQLHIFKKEDNYSLTWLQDFPLYSQPDNINIDPETNNLLIAVHPVTHLTVKHIEAPNNPTPSKVFMVNMRDGGHAVNITELYSDDGHTLWGSTVAAKYQKKMLVGSIKHKLLFCKIKIL